MVIAQTDEPIPKQSELQAYHRAAVFAAMSDDSWHLITVETLPNTRLRQGPTPVEQPTTDDRLPCPRLRGQVLRDGPRGGSESPTSFGQHRPRAADTPLPQPGRLRPLGIALLAVWLGIAGWFGLSYFGDRSAATNHLIAPTVSSEWTVGQRKIQDVRTGDMVLADNPEGPDDTDLFGKPDPATWRELTLRAPKSDGSWSDVTLDRPLWWLAEQEAELGATVDIQVPECGIDGHAEVLAIGPCPTPRPGPGQVVTGTFVHHAATVVDLYIEGLDEPIGVTANHAFWSEDRQRFVRVDELKQGERLRSLEGNPRVVEIIPRPGLHTIYNLEVQGEHVYYVAASGILVHNGKACDVLGDAAPEERQLKLWPDEPYNRRKHYGSTPTAAQQRSVPKGTEFDHDPTLAKHYYEGDGKGGMAGFNMTSGQRRQHARSLQSGGPAAPHDQRVQGAAAAAYSKKMKKYWEFD